MTKLEHDTYPFYIVAYNDSVSPNVVHYGKARQGQVVETGQPKHEIYEDENVWIDRINELKGVENWYQDNENQYANISGV